MADETIPQPVAPANTDVQPGQAGAVPPPPSGAGDAPPNLPPPPAGASDTPPEQNTENGQTPYDKHPISGVYKDIGEGAAQSLVSGVAGAGNIGNKLSGGLLDKGAEKIGDLLGLPKLHEGANPYESASAAAGDPKNAAQKVGYGGESLLEIISGDEALKGLSWADKLAESAKVAKVIEKVPIIAEYLKLGASAGKAMGELGPEELEAVRKSPLLTRMLGTIMDAGRLGTTQAGQTLARTGGDVKEAIKQGAETGISAGVLGGAFGLLGRATEKAGAAGEAVKTASEAGANAPTTVEAGQKVADQIQAANDQMHGDFESGIQKLKGDLGDQKVPYAGSPLQKAAKATLEGITDKQVIPGKTEATGILDEFGSQITKQGADKTVRTTKGALPEFGNLAGGSPESKNLLTSLSDPKKTGDLTIDELVQRRQQLGEKIGQLTKGATSSADRADVQVYQKLRDGIDDTIDSLAKNSGKPEASQDYEALRAAYKDKVNLFKEPIAQAFMPDPGTGKIDLDNAGKYLLAGGKTLSKVNTLTQIIGEDGVKDFGKDIVKRTLADASTESGQINPAKFAKDWKKIDSLLPEVKDKLFDVKNAQEGLGKLAGDLKSAANYQKLARAGIVLNPVGGPGLAIGMLASGDTASARDLLDKIANNPTAWKYFRTAGKIGATLESSPAARKAVGAAAYGAGNALSNIMGGAAAPLSQPDEDQNVVYTNQ